MRKLALDIGAASCGFAITDEQEIISSSLINLKFPENDFERIYEQIKIYLSEYKIDGLVIGYPLKIDGSKSSTTLMVEEVTERIKEIFNLPILFVNEQYSTKKAHEVMISAGLSRQKRKDKKDKIAAQVILQDYLEYYKNRWDK
ncbi:Holliday junction resolvase RuvX [Mycoplasmopsis cynos]|uniref:Putative pre-16S rRNA nuclease n=5 Tax=Mycoplasmopsis cynos TaxID=171284 RepID=L0RU95_MYCC1|nr:Holliday junction resolvase RuvX [Mycoplasmopsis cynos]MCU9935029.1 Holliday junction resolvase RuvX [Mycoplasmopsis cynos]UWV80756.1 Holliday junction resolvase RuvX [Mycoplasmopsis cynos]WQQ18736.1 Holliday junction resolvase RuvX [Mycoplasmopsis cynos]WQQ18910.1 Holliday junction resolvase RuvX [Mycoplasmopsis cynos]WQQ20102.1 Holliday junction resolvase RuvX [Mycoplasmopsis cynos]